MSSGGHLGPAADLHVLIMLSAKLFFFSTLYILDGLGGMKTSPPSPAAFLHPHGCCRDNMRFTLKNKSHDVNESADASFVSECSAHHFLVS